MQGLNQFVKKTLANGDEWFASSDNQIRMVRAQVNNNMPYKNWEIIQVEKVV